jgi:hypothetical protein
MKKGRIILITISLLAIISAAIMYFNFKYIGNSPTLPEEITLNKEWINDDEIMIKEILPLLSGVLNIADFLSNNKFNNEREKPYKRELGLGYSRTNFRHYRKGYTDIYVSILTDKNDNSIDSIISIGGNKYAMKIIDKGFDLSSIQEANISYYTHDTFIDIRHRNTILYKTFVNDYAQYFQINNEIFIPDEIKPEYEILFNAGMYIYRCGFPGDKFPKEREALAKILEMNNTNILLALLSSPSSQGRMYAIEGLFINRINDIINENEYTDILNKIIALNASVSISWGDVIHHTYINSIEYIYKIINNDINL